MTVQLLVHPKIPFAVEIKLIPINRDKLTIGYTKKSMQQAVELLMRNWVHTG